MRATGWFLTDECSLCVLMSHERAFLIRSNILTLNGMLCLYWILKRATSPPAGWFTWCIPVRVCFLKLKRLKRNIANSLSDFCSAGAGGVVLHEAWHPAVFSLTNWEFSDSESWKIGACGPDADQTQCGRIDIGPAECVKEEAAPVTGGEEQCVQYACFHMCVCVCDRLAASKKDPSARGPSLPSFPLPRPHTLQTSTQASLALSPRNWAADPGQSSLIVPSHVIPSRLFLQKRVKATYRWCVFWAWACQCSQTGRGQGNDRHLRHDGCTFINLWPFLLFSFTRCSAPVCFLKRNWTWTWSQRVFCMCVCVCVCVCVFMIADSFNTSSTLRILLCWDKSHFPSLICIFSLRFAISTNLMSLFWTKIRPATFLQLVSLTDARLRVVGAATWA